MEYTRTLEAGKAKISVVFTSLPFRLLSRLDDMTSQMFFEQGGRRTGTNLELGRIKDIVIYNAVAPSSKGNRTVRLSHPAHMGGEKVTVTLKEQGQTLDNFPILDSDPEYMGGLDTAFMREIVKLVPYLAPRYGLLFSAYVDEETLEAQEEEDPTESGETEEEGTSSDEQTSTGVLSNSL